MAIRIKKVTTPAPSGAPITTFTTNQPIEETMKQETPNNNRTTEQAPKESSNTVVVITWESGMVNVYRKDSKELIEVLIHEHHMIYEVMEAEMIP
jgi:hypothetical protein